MTSKKSVGPVELRARNCGYAGGTSEAIVSFSKLSLINGC